MNSDLSLLSRADLLNSDTDLSTKRWSKCGNGVILQVTQLCS